MFSLDLMHDITCQKDTAFASLDRSFVVRKFFLTLQHLTKVDKLLMHLESFANNDQFQDIPESIHKGNPLFTPKMGSHIPELYHKEFAILPFTNFWRPICTLDVNMWHR